MIKIFCKAMLITLIIMALGAVLRSTGLAQEAPPGNDKQYMRQLPMELARLIHNPQTDIPNLVVFDGGSLSLDLYNQFRLTAKDITGVLPGPQRNLDIVTVYPNSFGIKLWLVISQGEEGSETYSYFPLKDDAVRTLQLGLAWAFK